MRQSGRRDTASAGDARETRRTPRLLAVIVLVAAAIALVVVGLTTSSSDGTQKIKGPVPYTVLTTVPGETGSSSVTTSTSSAASASANTSNSATASALRNSAASTNPAVSASSVGSGAFNAQVMTAARTAGYLMAVSTHTGSRDDPKALLEIVRRQVSAFMSLGSFGKLVQ